MRETSSYRQILDCRTRGRSPASNCTSRSNESTSGSSGRDGPTGGAPGATRFAPLYGHEAERTWRHLDSCRLLALATQPLGGSGGATNRPTKGTPGRTPYFGGLVGLRRTPRKVILRPITRSS